MPRKKRVAGSSRHPPPAGEQRALDPGPWAKGTFCNCCRVKVYPRPLATCLVETLADPAGHQHLHLGQREPPRLALHGLCPVSLSGENTGRESEEHSTPHPQAASPDGSHPWETMLKCSFLRRSVYNLEYKHVLTPIHHFVLSQWVCCDFASKTYFMSQQSRRT